MAANVTFLLQISPTVDTVTGMMTEGAAGEVVDIVKGGAIADVTTPIIATITTIADTGDHTDTTTMTTIATTTATTGDTQDTTVIQGEIHHPQEDQEMTPHHQGEAIRHLPEVIMDQTTDNHTSKKAKEFYFYIN